MCPRGGCGTVGVFPDAARNPSEKFAHVLLSRIEILYVPPPMNHFIMEIKARCNDHKKIRDFLLARRADCRGTDHQTDTYFRVNHGRLKLREGDIENFLVFYERENQAGPKPSNVVLFATDPQSPLKEILTRSLGVLVVVDKAREIYFLDNVKFHIDTVRHLGAFLEIEAIGGDDRGKEHLLRQCNDYLALLRIREADLISVSYSDLLLAERGTGS